MQNFWQNLTKNEITELCKGVHCVDLRESFQTHIFLQNFASIQPRTSPLKFARSSGGGEGEPRDAAEEHRAVPGGRARPAADRRKIIMKRKQNLSRPYQRNIKKEYRQKHHTTKSAISSKTI